MVTGEPLFGLPLIVDPEMMRSVNLPIQDINKCKKEYEIEDGSFSDTSICAGGESSDNPKNACKVRFKLKRFVN